MFSKELTMRKKLAYWLRVICAAGIILMAGVLAIACPANPNNDDPANPTGTNPTGTNPSESPPLPELETIAVPAANPAGGMVSSGTTINLSTAAEGGAIYYTLDGSKPTAESTRYSDLTKPKITEKVTLLRAIAVKTGAGGEILTSEVLNADYFLPRTYEESVIKVVFTGEGETATVVVENLQPHNKVYLGILNDSNREIKAINTGGVANVFTGGRSAVSAMPSEQTHPEALSEFIPPVKQQSKSRAASAAPFVGDTKTDSFVGYDGLLGPVHRYEVKTRLRKIGRHHYLWVEYYQRHWLDENPKDMIEEFIDVSDEQVEEISAKYDETYSIMSELFEYENYSQTNKYGDTRVIIEAYSSRSDWAGYFQPSEPDSIFISTPLLNSTEDAVLVLVHETAHLLENSIKSIFYQKDVPAWQSEMTAYGAMLILAERLGIPSTARYHPHKLMPAFIEGGYNQYAFNGTRNGVFAFVDYLIKNYNGPILLRDIVTNEYVGFEAITAALSRHQNGLTFNDAFSRFAEPLLFAGIMPAGVMSYDKTVSATINGIELTIPGFNLWENGGPKVYPVNPTDLRPFSISIQSTSQWESRTGSIAITLNRPADDSVQLYLMVR